MDRSYWNSTLFGVDTNINQLTADGTAVIGFEPLSGFYQSPFSIFINIMNYLAIKVRSV
jgi:hypothetical protein